MVRHLSPPCREASPLGRWASVRLQAPAAKLALAALASACGGATRADPPPLHHVTPDEIVVRTDRFAFHMGVRVDDTWPASAEQTRAALGRAAEALLDDEDTTVEILARQLGVRWPVEPLDFDVVLTPDAHATPACETKLPRRIEVTLATIAHPEPELFFACVLERSLTRLAEESALARGMGAQTGDAGPAGRYGCVARYAVAALIVARTHDARVSRRVEVGLGDACTPRELDWLGNEWVKRVREDETAGDFGARAGRELSTAD